MKEKTLNKGKGFTLLLAALTVVIAAALPRLVHAYWACTIVNDGCWSYTECRQYNDCTDQPMKGWKYTVQQNC